MKDYSSIYSIKDYFKSMLPLYFDESQLSTATVGALGMFIDINSSFTEDTINIASRYITEIMPGESRLPDFVYSQAANYGINDILAKPSKMSMLLLIKESDVINNTELVGEHQEFTLDSDLSILVGDLPFSIPYNIKIRSTMYHGEWNHMAFYDQSYTNVISGEAVPFIKTMKTNINGDIWLVLRVNVYQYHRKRIDETISTNSILNIPYIDVPFSDQLCNFEVFYTEPNGSSRVQLTKRGHGESPLYEPFVYHKFVDDNVLRLTFANDDRYWLPKFNSSIMIYTYSTNGEAGNFPFNREGIEVTVGSSEQSTGEFSTSKTIFPMGLSQGNAVGGTNQLDLEQIRLLTEEKQKTVNSYTTDHDLNVYFNNFAAIYGHYIMPVKQRDDFAGREYSAYIKLNGKEDVIPTNTADILLSQSDIDERNKSMHQFIIKPGATFIYDGDDTNTLVRMVDDYDGEPDIEYTMIPLMVISNQPNKVNMYINSIDRDIDVEYSYFNLDSTFNFVVKRCSIFRNALAGEDSYHIEMELSRVDGVFNDLNSSDFLMQTANGELDIEKLEVLIVFDTTVGDYIRMEYQPKDDEEDNSYSYIFTADIKTDDVINNDRILLNNLTKRSTGLPDERLIDIVNPSIKFAVFYDYNKPSSHEYNDIELISNHTLCNVYTTVGDNLYFAYPLNLVRTHVMFENDSESDLGYKFRIKKVPMIGQNYLFNDGDLTELLNYIISEHTFLDTVRESLHGLFSIDMKFFNTYGRGRNFLIGDGKTNNIINHVNCSIDFGIKFYDGIIVSDYIEPIKQYIKDFFESLNNVSNGVNQAYISVLNHKLYETFGDQIRYSIFYSINGYDTKCQVVECWNDEDSANDIDYIPEYLTITSDDIHITIL